MILPLLAILGIQTLGFAEQSWDENIESTCSTHIDSLIINDDAQEFQSVQDQFKDTDMISNISDVMVYMDKEPEKPDIVAGHPAR